MAPLITLRCYLMIGLLISKCRTGNSLNYAIRVGGVRLVEIHEFSPRTHIWFRKPFDIAAVAALVQQ